MTMTAEKPNTSMMKISQAARAAGVSCQTIEYYILIGLISPIRNRTGGRLFDEGLIRRIRLIRRLNSTGYTLRSIRETYMRRA